MLNDNEKKPAGIPEIQIAVTGQQFFWTYEYPHAVTGAAPLRSYQLYLPKGDTVYFNMRSRDVIHAFWIPAFRLQEDVVPGHHDPLPGDPRSPRQLPDRLQPAVRRRALADALRRARRDARELPAWLRSQAAEELERRHRLHGHELGDGVELRCRERERRPAGGLEAHAISTGRRVIMSARCRGPDTLMATTVPTPTAAAGPAHRPGGPPASIGANCARRASTAPPG